MSTLAFECGHIYKETYQLNKPDPDELIPVKGPNHTDALLCDCCKCNIRVAPWTDMMVDAGVLRSGHRAIFIKDFEWLEYAGDIDTTSSYCIYTILDGSVYWNNKSKDICQQVMTIGFKGILFEILH